jgi:ABC-2 type transport system ATP-binding protein
MGETDAAVEVRDLVKRYRRSDFNAVDGVSFDVMAGQLFCLLGPNGAGKTTCVSILTTTLRPTSGSVRIAGHDAATGSSRVRREIGVVFQAPSLDMNLSAEENVRLHAILYGLFPWRPSFRTMPRDYRLRVVELADVLGISDAMARPVRTFSGGMRRKLEIVRTLVHRPRVLFLDEPTTGLDPESRRSLWSYLRQVRTATGTTILLTTHYLEETEGSDAICILHRGRVIAHGTPAEVTAGLVEPHLVLDTRPAERAGLERELRELGVEVTGGGPFRVPADPAGAQRLLRSLRTELTVLRSGGGSVEEAYLRLVGQEAAEMTA